MLSGHMLTKTVRQWGLVIAMGVAGFAAGIAVFTLIGRDGIVHALNAAPAIVVGLGLSVLLSLAFLAIGALVAVAQERWRNLLSRIALNNMTQGLCMFDGAARLVLCNVRYIDMHLLRREQLRSGHAPKTSDLQVRQDWKLLTSAFEERAETARGPSSSSAEIAGGGTN